VTTLLARPTPPSGLALLASAIAGARVQGEAISVEAEQLVVELFRTEGRSLVRLARLFVDDRDAAEDLVQEAFLRLARHAGRISVVERAPAYLRSIVLNLARDHNRRGLVSLRHLAAAGREIDVVDDVADVLARSDDHRRVIAEVRRLPRRQRDCITLRYFEELSIDAVAATLDVSPNSVKTHLRRAMASLGAALDEPPNVDRR
jgi:RNA polymerase sigma factor (sigma-70 family)